MGTPPENMEPTQEAPLTPAPAPAGGGRNVTPVQIAIVVGALVVLLGLVWFFFLRGGGEEPAGPVAPPAAPAPTEEPVDIDEPDDADDAPVETFEVFAPRDPFEPLISAAGAGGGGGDAGTEPGDGTDGDDGDGTGTDGDGTGTGTGTTDGDAGSRDVGGRRVKVVDVYREGGQDRAQIQVDSTVYTVDEGERFAENFQLVAASGQCATMLFGDDEFTLCEGEEILK